MHENLEVVGRIGAAIQAGSIADAADCFEPHVVWHYFNPKLPDLAGDHVGLAGIENFFQQLASRTNRTFTVRPVSAHPIGEELVVAHGRIELEMTGRRINTDALVVWRLRSRRVVEVWDIPAVYGASTDGA